MDQNELFHNNLLQDHTSLQQDFSLIVHNYSVIFLVHYFTIFYLLAFSSKKCFELVFKLYSLLYLKRKLENVLLTPML
jgi:hypothetical protein